MENFKNGYNCAQSVFVAFSDVMGIDEASAARMSSPFGGGMGRMREVCGAVSGMYMALGVIFGYDNPKDVNAKKELYADVRRLAKEFSDKYDTIVCRELMGIKKGEPDNVGHDPRCVRFVVKAAVVLDDYIEKCGKISK